MMSADTLLTTKFRIPAARPGLVSRPHLAARLDEGLRSGQRLSLVSAPAGFGKSTLVAGWAISLDRPVAWLTLDRADGDPAGFLRYLLAAVQHSLPETAAQIDARLSDGESSQAMATAFINTLTAINTPVVLVLDDYHLVTEYAIHDLLTHLLDHQPPGLHVIVISREDPPLPLARLRARGQLSEIRERDLRFTHTESLDFFNRTMGLNLSSEAVTVLETRTEGWVTALQLAGAAMRQMDASDSFIAAFAGDDRFITDYVMAEVLAREDEDVRDFLQQTSIVDRLCAPLCAALTGRPDSQEMLERLDRANLFIIPLDNRREWYRYHSLFGEVLRLSITDGEKSRLHQQAAAWYAANGLADLAAEHQRLSAELWEASHVAGRPPSAQALLEPLSEREIEILGLLAEGDSNAEIAHKLFITVGTVKRHIINIYGKLGVHSRAKAVVRARDIGLIS